LAAVGKVLAAAATVWPLVLVGRTIDRFGKGVRSAPRDALIASSVPPDARGRAFGFHRAGDSLGAVVGPLVAFAALASMGDDLDTVLWWAVVPATMSALLVVFVREERRVTVPPVGERGSASHSPLPTPLPRPFWGVTAVLVAVALVNFSDVLVLLRVSDLGFSTKQVVLAYVLFNAVCSLGSYPAGLLADRWPHHHIYAAGLVAFAAGYLGLAVVHRGSAVYVMVAVCGLFPALTDGVGKAWIASLVPDEHLGRAQGTFQALSSGAVLVAGTWAGLLWDVGPGDGSLPLAISGAGALAAAATMLALRGRMVGR
jgi:MFS family permease